MSAYAPLPLVREMLRRQRWLGGFALLCLVVGVLAVIAGWLDTRTIDGVSVWLKPLKFALSIGVFAATAAWFFGYVQPQRRHAWLMRITVAVLIVSAGFELFWITWQGAHGLRSHFNFDTPFYALMYALMGVGAVSLVATTLPLAWEIARRPAPGLDPAYVFAVVVGLVLTFALGGALGGTISANTSSVIGEYASAIPLFAWNQAGGDLRVAHFLGIHAQQAMPFAALALGALGWRSRLAVAGVAALYTALTLWLWMAARAGQPLVPGAATPLG